MKTITVVLAAVSAYPPRLALCLWYTVLPVCVADLDLFQVRQDGKCELFWSGSIAGNADFQLRDETGIPAIIELPPSFCPSCPCSSVEYPCWSEHFTSWTRWTGPWAESHSVCFRYPSPGTSSSTVNGSGYCPPATPTSADFKFSSTNTSIPGIVGL